MKITHSNNETLLIQARDEKDYIQSLKVANRIVEEAQGVIVIGSVDEREFWIDMCACWDNYQAKDMREAYNAAKKEVA